MWAAGHGGGGATACSHTIAHEEKWLHAHLYLVLGGEGRYLCQYACAGREKDVGLLQEQSEEGKLSQVTDF